MAASFPPLSRMRPLPPIHRDVFVGMIIFNLFGVVRAWNTRGCRHTHAPDHQYESLSVS